MLRPRFRFLPQGRDSGGLLPWVIAVMMYLCALALVSGLLLFTSMRDWSSELDRQLTVQISVADDAARDKETNAAAAALTGIAGVAEARIMSDRETAALLEPWLGAGNVTGDLPVPKMIAVTLAEDEPAKLADLRAALNAAAPHAKLDDHQQWLGALKEVTRVFGATIDLIFLLVLAATVAIVIFGTRARLANYRSTLEIMHMIGAEDKLIAREFQHRFMLHGLRGGAIGAAAALLTLLAVAFFTKDMAAGFLPSIKPNLLVGAGLLLIPLLSALLTMLTARWTVLRALKDTP